MKKNFWTAERDNRLIDLQQAGLSANEIGLELGATRSAVLGRSARLRGLRFPSTAARAGRERREREAKRARRQETEQREIDQMMRAISRGDDRKGAIARAAISGVRYRVIARAVGVTHQRIEQIVRVATGDATSG